MMAFSEEIFGKNSRKFNKFIFSNNEFKLKYNFELQQSSNQNRLCRLKYFQKKNKISCRFKTRKPLTARSQAGSGYVTIELVPKKIVAADTNF